jgi:transposase-like protein
MGRPNDPPFGRPDYAVRGGLAEQERCPKCKRLRWVKRLEVKGADKKSRRFECGKCGHGFSVFDDE